MKGDQGDPGPGLPVDADGAVQDASLLPTAHCKSVTLSNPAAGDLAAQIRPLLASYRCLHVTLQAQTVWSWNEQLSTREGQILSIVGDGYGNGATNLTVIIQMTQNPTWTNEGVDYRDPSRLEVASNARVSIIGVQIQESANDPRAMTKNPGGALFTSSGVNAVLELSQTRIQSTEDVVGVGSRAFVNVLFGHTWIDTQPNGRAIKAVKSYTGWSFGGGFAFVHSSHTHLGEGSATGAVTNDTSTKITYSN